MPYMPMGLSWLSASCAIPMAGSQKHSADRISAAYAEINCNEKRKIDEFGPAAIFVKERLYDESEKPDQRDGTAIIFMDFDIRFGLRAGAQHRSHFIWTGSGSVEVRLLRRGSADSARRGAGGRGRYDQLRFVGFLGRQFLLGHENKNFFEAIEARRRFDREWIGTECLALALSTFPMGRSFGKMWSSPEVRILSPACTFRR